MDFLRGIHFRHVVMPEQLREHYSLLEEGCMRASDWLRSSFTVCCRGRLDATSVVGWVGSL